jgi:putative spermidine/putrescine transport system permease protein
MPLRNRLAERGIDTSLLLLAPAVLLILGLFLYPLIYGVTISFQPLDGGGPLANYRDFFDDPYLRGSIWKTVRLAFPVALLSVLVAAPIAYQARRDFPGRKLITVTLMLPITFGSVLIAQGMSRAFAPFGWINLALERIGLGPADLLYNYRATFIAAFMTILPFSFLMLMGFFGGIDRSLEQAATTLGASRAVRFFQIILPLAAPGIMTAFMLALVEAFAIFPSAILIGQPDNATHVLTIPIYQAASQKFDYGQASAIAIILTVIELAFLGLVVLIRGRFYSGPAAGGKG